MNSPNTFNDLMSLISFHVQEYMAGKLANVVKNICTEYDISYDDVMRSLPSDMGLMTAPVLSKKETKRLQLGNEETEKTKKKPAPKKTEPVDELDKPVPAPKKKPAPKKTEPVDEPDESIDKLEKPVPVPKNKLAPKRKPSPKKTEPVIPGESIGEAPAPKKKPAPKKPVSKKTEETDDTVQEANTFIRPTKRPSKKPKQAQPVDPKISDLPRDEQEWFKALLIKDTELDATTSSYFPEVATAPPPETEVYSDDEIIDDYYGSDDEYDKYVLEE